MKKIIIIPAYEPDDNLIKVVRSAADTDCELIVVDDGSKEGYFELFKEAGKYAHVISYSENHGKGFALKTAYEYVNRKYANKKYIVVTIDSDGQHSIKDAINVLEVAEEHPGSLVLGSRMGLSDSPIKSRFGNAVTRFVYRIASGVKIYDTQTGLRAFSSELMDTMLGIEGERYEYEMKVLMELPKKNISIIEVPIETIYIDNNSGTHFHPLRDSYKIYKEILKYSLSSFISFLTDYCLYSILLLALGNGLIVAANIGARIISASVNFMLNYKYVFKAKESVFKCAVKYVILAVTVIIVNSILLYFLVDGLGCNAFGSKIVVEIVMFVLNWIVQRLFIFGKQENV